MRGLVQREDTIFNLILLLHLMVTAVVLRHVLKDVCEKNKYVFYQLTVTRGAAFVVDFLSKSWLVLLFYGFPVCDHQYRK